MIVSAVINRAWEPFSGDDLMDFLDGMLCPLGQTIIYFVIDKRNNDVQVTLLGSNRKMSPEQVRQLYEVGPELLAEQHWSGTGFEDVLDQLTSERTARNDHDATTTGNDARLAAEGPRNRSGPLSRLYRWCFG